MLLGKACIQFFFFQLWVNFKADRIINFVCKQTCSEVNILRCIIRYEIKWITDSILYDDNRYAIPDCNPRYIYIVVYSFEPASRNTSREIFLYIICLDYILRTSIDLIKENGFTMKKMARKRCNTAETIIDADYADDQVLLANTPDQAKTLLHNQKQAVRSTGLYVN